MKKPALKGDLKRYIGEPWEILSSEVVFEKMPWWRIRRDMIRLPNGKETDYFVCDAVENNVNVVAVTEDKEVILIRQYKHPVKETILETIGGMAANGEDPLEAARRELEEEAGYVSDKWTKLADTCEAAGILQTRCHIFLAQDAKPTGVQKLDEKEFAAVETVPLNEISGMLGKEITDLPRIASISLALQELGIFPR
ncbi:NUDIX hydrolase [Patescibacteria group bacterium]